MKSRRPSYFRNQTGSYLIELLVALAISGFLAVALAASLSEQMRVTTGADNQMQAAELAQEVIERFRQTSRSLPPPGTYPIQVNSDDGVGSGSYWFQNRPLSLDRTNLDYPGFLGASNSSNVQTVSVTLAPGVTPTTTLITVTVSWTESTANRSASFSTTLAKTSTSTEAGIHL
ncbi:hypothetical protein BH10CYA1_BH10CYA1_05940 [soil metagenome]